MKILYTKFFGRYYPYIFIVMVSLLMFIPIYDNDTFFLINIGKYIFNNGFPSVDPFTFHTLSVPIQQWLTGIIFYCLYNFLGNYSLIVLLLLMYCIFGITIYKLSMVVSNYNQLVSTFITIFTIIPLRILIVLRPQLFSTEIFLLEILIIESFIKTHKKKLLLLLPLLSVLLVNLHAAMWLMFFVLLLPYIVEIFKLNFATIHTDIYPKNYIIVIGIVSLAVGFINPYIYDNMIYVIHSYGNPYINAFVSEMKSPNFKTTLGYIYFFFISVIFLTFIIKNNSFKFRYLMFASGTVFLSLTSVRNFGFLIIGLILVLSYHFRNSFRNITTINFNKSFIRLFSVAACTVFVLVVAFSLLFTKSPTDILNPKSACDYIINNYKNDIILYNDYDNGGYVEFRNIKAFIDPRAEIFTKKLNGKYDILKDYVDANNAGMHYIDFINRYRFNLFLVRINSGMDVYLSHDGKYIVKYKDDLYKIYEPKK